MNSYKLVIAYDGTRYHGWQWQENSISVDSVIRDTFLKAFRQERMHLVGASRTDAGVHADGQVIRLGTLLDLDPEKLRYVLNMALPDDIVVRECERIAEESSFHPQHNIQRKTYVYRFFLKRPAPMVQRYGYFVPCKIDTYKLANALSVFVGTHDFRAFSKEDLNKDTTRTIESVSLAPCDQTGGYKISITGTSFLRHMIRRIVGASFEIAKRPNRSCSELKQLLLVPSSVSKNLSTAPAKGLCLESITYTNK
jgi:tRNA pseudouridine38-40 synthase